MISVRQETERETALLDTLRPRISIFMETVIGTRGASNYPIVEVYNDGSKTQASHMKVPPGYAVLDCGAAKSLCGAKPVALMAQTCAREGKRVGDERDTGLSFPRNRKSDCQFIHGTSCSWVG